MITTYETSLQLFIDGAWRAGEGRDQRPVFNPVSGDTLAGLPIATAADLDQALAAAERGWPVWRAKSADERAALMHRAAGLIRDRVEHIATILTMEQGKPIAEARGEVLSAAGLFDYFAEQGKRIDGRIVPRPIGQRAMVLRQPVGPVAGFSPWNFPVNLMVKKIAPALAAGCVVIAKAPEEAPASTGAVGKHLMRLAADNVQRITMELGGHAPVLVFDDCDLEVTLDKVVAQKFRNAGQVCVSPTRFYVQEGIYDAFVRGFAERTSRVKVGDGLDPATQMGPLANARRAPALEGLIEDAVAKGARIVAGGERGDQGYFFQPTALADVPLEALAMNEEPFCPLALIRTFATEDEAMVQANRLPYGLAAFLFSEDGRRINRVADALESGMVGVNGFAISSHDMPFGGIKESGFGSESGPEGLDGYLVTKAIHVY